MNAVTETYLVIGSGSIARRHMMNIKELFPSVRVGCVSASGRALGVEEVGADTIVYESIELALLDSPTLAIVASPAPFHVNQALRLIKAGVPVLVEKPLSTSLIEFAAEGGELLEHEDKIEVGYNLRFMPSATKLKSLLNERFLGNIYNVIVDVGQYLPHWRPASDYRVNVSARQALGGGVLLELSHELDYLKWLFGKFSSVYCVSRNSGALEVDVEDQVDAILVNSHGLVTNLHMDFLQRTPTRTCKILGEHGTLIWDLLRNRIVLFKEKDAEIVLFDDPHYDRNQMYKDELAHFSNVASGLSQPLVGLKDALETLALIDALKRSSASQEIIKIEEYLS
ncbi:Gfo/Idh/MocA family oxidoreductase [Pseudomonas sp. 14P_8.1_Bac3]|uniref:Gfo/Idh/MocA family protein n=1 Tax=Pseudomonas sp. 14P_8.1_Bac3 TaxID=2971621 RepID=UPI0021CA643B|nr:Gfo/Idh/MocA family oxidoreductase [Pseudomonas sp. 14P_8.1_Bac3]MCU1762131.1 Gfo/Idh/MocA family oxidoreductase [Pseudomonas sp. 14P_8.1_Bac3]